MSYKRKNVASPSIKSNNQDIGEVLENSSTLRHTSNNMRGFSPADSEYHKNNALNETLNRNRLTINLIKTLDSSEINPSLLTNHYVVEGKVYSHNNSPKEEEAV